MLAVGGLENVQVEGTDGGAFLSVGGSRRTREEVVQTASMAAASNQVQHQKRPLRVACLTRQAANQVTDVMERR